MSKWGKLSSKLRTEGLYNWVPVKYTFTPNREDVLESRFRVRYSNTCDSYYRDWEDKVDPDSPRILPNWKRALNDWDSVRRVVDENTGKVYHDKFSGSTDASLKWSFAFGCCGLLVDQVTLRLCYDVNEGVEVSVTLTGDDGQKAAHYREAGKYITFHELENSAKLDLSIHVTGKAGQVTRLFPQTIMGGVDHPLDLQVTLKPPAETLDRPRMLVGVMYSSTQAVQVDGRHFKENSSSTSGRGFLHIHLVKARGLPVLGNQASCAKCCLLPDAKKLKCKTAAKKGSDPDWNEEFLVVGVTYHEIKRGALEVYISTKNSNRIGGLRLSVGYRNVITAQTALLSKILERLTGSAFPQNFSENGLAFEENETDVNGSDTGTEDILSPDQDGEEDLRAGRSKVLRKVYRTTTRLSDLKVIVVEDEEEIEVDESDLASFPEEDASFCGTVGSLDILNIVRRREGMSTSQTEMAANEERATGSLHLPSVDVVSEKEAWESVSVEGPSHDSNDGFPEALKDSSADIASVGQITAETREAPEKTATSSQINGYVYLENSSVVIRTTNWDLSSLSTETRAHDSRMENTDLNHIARETVVGNGLPCRGRAKSEIQTRGSHGTEALRLKNSANCTNSAKQEKERARRSRSHPGPNPMVIQPSHLRGQSNVASEDELEATLEKNRLLRKALSDAEARYQGSSHSSTEDQPETNSRGRRNSRQSTAEQLVCAVRGLGRKLSLGKSSFSGPNSRSAEKKKGLERYLEANIDVELLDSQGLEIDQWLNVVNRPKQWHYCWHVLRSDMTYKS